MRIQDGSQFCLIFWEAIIEDLEVSGEVAAMALWRLIISSFKVRSLLACYSRIKSTSKCASS